MINCTYFFLNIQHFCTQLYICELCFVFVNRILWIYIFILCTWISFCNFFFLCMWIGFHACELGYVCIMSFVWIIIDTNLTPYKKSCSLNINKYYFDSSCYYSQWEIKFKEYKFKKIVSFLVSCYNNISNIVGPLWLNVLDKVGRWDSGKVGDLHILLIILKFIKNIDIHWSFYIWHI